MKQLVILSGKGGTGKTTITASFAALAERAVLADCDVDAADLHLLLKPEVRETHPFHSMPHAFIDLDLCTSCGKCREACRFDAISETFVVNPLSCEGCRLCIEICPVLAVRTVDSTPGEWYVSDTRHGPMVHARLGIAQENSGKLVMKVKERASEIATERGLKLVIVDGAPGIGCPVISSLSGADLVLVVVEPTLSGIHDMERVVNVSEHFGIVATCAVNKADINLENTERIERWCKDRGVPVAGRIPFDRRVTEAMIHGHSIVEHMDDGAAVATRRLWARVEEILDDHEND
jgi:MinD superfamily P-loop ATPase